MRGAIGLYEGVKVHVNHDIETPTDRPWKDWVGVVEKVHLRADGLYGDVRLRKESPLFEEICEAAEHFSSAFGMSHVANGDSHMVDGCEVVEAITEVHAVDLVLVPATTAGLFESEGSSLLDDAKKLADGIGQSKAELGALATMLAASANVGIETADLESVQACALGLLAAMIVKGFLSGQDIRYSEPAEVLRHLEAVNSQLATLVSAGADAGDDHEDIRESFTPFWQRNGYGHYTN
jgi:hypothetical protein